MKLPDFTFHAGLLKLRELMGAEGPGNFSVKYRAARITLEEAEQLVREGIDVAIDQIHELRDGTLVYKNSRVIVYIRDVALYDGSFEPPKFHVGFCSTLHQMVQRNRFGRYVVATRTDGTFQINKILGQKKISNSYERLDICQNCLDLLSWDNFSFSMARDRRKSIVRAFAIDRFFEVYPKSWHVHLPSHTDVLAPVNDYPDDFEQFATKIKSERGWKCSECSFSASRKDERRFLQLHHINGLKYDSDPTNLQVVCLGCHAEKHPHMKRLPQYMEFFQKYRAHAGSVGIRDE